MSGFLRNTLSLVGKAKYATTISTKYLQIMTLTTSRINNSMLLDRPEYSQAYESKRFYNTEGNNKSTHVGPFKVSLSSGRIGFIIDESIIHEKNFILSPTLIPKHNEETIKTENNSIQDEKTSFNFGNLNVSLDGSKVKLQIQDTGETFILNDAFYVKAYSKPPKTLKDATIKELSPRYLSTQIISSAKLTSKSALGIFSEVITNLPRLQYESSTATKNDGLTAAPNKCGEMKLQFPMTVSLEGPQLVTQIKNSDDNLIVHHTVNIDAYKELAGNSKNEIVHKIKDETLKIRKIDIQLESGDLIIEALKPADRRISIKQKVRIIVDLDSAVPSIVVKPLIKSSIEVAFEF